MSAGLRFTRVHATWVRWCFARDDWTELDRCQRMKPLSPPDRVYCDGCGGGCRALRPLNSVHIAVTLDGQNHRRFAVATCGCGRRPTAENGAEGFEAVNISHWHACSTEGVRARFFEATCHAFNKFLGSDVRAGGQIPGASDRNHLGPLFRSLSFQDGFPHVPRPWKRCFIYSRGLKSLGQRHRYQLAEYGHNGLERIAFLTVSLKLRDATASWMSSAELRPFRAWVLFG